MTRVNKVAIGTLHQSTVTQIQTKLTTLSQGSPGTIPFQGQAALSIQNNFTTAATNLNTLAAPMNSTTTTTSSGLSDPWPVFQDNFASINQTFVSGLQEIPNMTRQFVLFDLGVLAVELIIGGAVALPTVGLGDAVEVPVAGVVDVVILAVELLTVAVWFVGDLLVWAICVIAALVALGIEEIIYHIQSPSTTTSTSTTTTHPISITVISGGASQGGETVITNGDGTGADAGGWSTDDQADLAWTAADACAAARASYIKRTGNGNINYALGLLSLDGSPMPPETYGPILGVGLQDTHSEQVIVNYWKNIGLPQLRSHVKPTGSNLVLMIFTREEGDTLTVTSVGQINTRKKHHRRKSPSRKEAAMTDTPHSQEKSGSTDLLQAPWLHQSYLIGHPLEQKERYAEALEVYNQVLEQDREHILAHLLKGRVLFSLKRDEEALATFQQALQLAEQAVQRNRTDPQNWIYQGDALWLLDSQQADAALAAYDEAIRLAPENPEAYVNKGWMLFALTRPEALQMFEKAQELRPKDADIHYRLNCALWEMGKHEEALQAIEQAIALDPTSPRFSLARSTVLSSLGREEEARQAMALYEHMKNDAGSKY